MSCGYSVSGDESGRGVVWRARDYSVSVGPQAQELYIYRNLDIEEHRKVWRIDGFNTLR